MGRADVDTGNINRSPTSYELNPEEERNKWVTGWLHEKCSWLISFCFKRAHTSYQIIKKETNVASNTNFLYLNAPPSSFVHRLHQVMWNTTTVTKLAARICCILITVNHHHWTSLQFSHLFAKLLDQETTKRPLQSSSQAATCLLPVNFSKV